jgi:hypothetical protein
MDAFSVPNNGVLSEALVSFARDDALIEWDVYVDQSKASVLRGSTATLDAFVGLSPPTVEIHPCVIAASPRNRSPTVRCSSRTDPQKLLEISNVDSVDKVFRILTKHLRVKVCLSRI